MKIISNDLLIKLASDANQHPRKRVMFCLHDSPNDTLHRMVNVLQPDTYVQPHKHVAHSKREVFVILKGSLLVCLFDDNGTLTDTCVIGVDTGNYVAEIPSNTYHTIIPLQVGTCVFECKDGPYNPNDDKVFAEWAPSELSGEGLHYNKSVLDSLHYNFPDFV